MWKGRYARTGLLDGPLVFNSVFLNFLFNVITLTFFGTTIYLIIKDWMLVLYAFSFKFLLHLLLPKVAEFIEVAALYPITYLYTKLKDL